MNVNNHNVLAPLVGAVVACLCHPAVLWGQDSGGTYPPPAGAGIVATLQADQEVYTNQPAAWWCPPCVTNSPPCMQPCYLIKKEETAVAWFTLRVANEYRLPRTFIFFSGQQFDVEILDQTGRVVVAWSDGKMFTQSLTALSLGPGQMMLFTADVPLTDRDGQQLNGTYQVRAFLTSSGPPPRVEVSGQIAVTLAL